MADGYVGDRYVECEGYTVLDQYRIDERYPDGDEDADLRCYCGAEAPYRAKVGFHMKMDVDEEYGWGNSITMEYVVDRCADHTFNADPDCRACRQDDVATVDVTAPVPGRQIEIDAPANVCRERLRDGWRLHVHEEAADP